jgi:hypothetical protein
MNFEVQKSLKRIVSCSAQTDCRTATLEQRLVYLKLAIFKLHAEDRIRVSAIFPCEAVGDSLCTVLELSQSRTFEARTTAFARQL